MNTASSTAYESFLRTRRQEILERVRAACARVGRNAQEIEIMAVSKTVDAHAVRLAQRVGYEVFGENRPQELVRKLAALKEDEAPSPPFDMIGNLQTNKINQVLGRVRQIQSIASTHVARAVSERAKKRLLLVPVLLEVNISGESTKSGFTPEALLAEISALVKLEGISLRGLMTMAPAGDLFAARQTFRGLKALQGELEHDLGLPLSTLSCGMSDDFEVAIEEGSTLVRLGRVVFDEDYRWPPITQTMSKGL